MFTTELQYVVVRYMLNELGDEAANVALFAVTDDPPRIMYKFLPHPEVKSRRDARIKVDLINRFQSYAEVHASEMKSNSDAQHPFTINLFGHLSKISGNMVRVGAPRSVLTNDVEKEFDLLFNQLIHPVETAANHRTTITRDPYRHLRSAASKTLVHEFRKGYGVPLSRHIFEKSYEVKGKTHNTVFDLAWKGIGKRSKKEHIFQHVLVLPDVEESVTQAAALCWRWGDLQDKHGTDRDLTAVLYQRNTHSMHHQAEVTRILEKEDIAVTNMQELPNLAQRLSEQPQLFGN